MRSLLVTICLVLAISAISAPAAAIDEKIADRLWNAAKVVDELINAPDSDISKELLKRAECVAVIPGLKKAAFGFGGELGRGAVTCRLDAGKGPFGPPAMISLTGGSFGLQIGGQETDVVMLFMQPDSLKYLLRDKVTLGADASAAAGPKGRTASAETNPTMRSEILTYSRSRGVFGGVSLKGSVLRPDKDANSNLYGRTVDVKELVQQGNVAIPDPAKKFIEAVSRAGGTR
jgi:lipid-binding SYLF domain-containing protein